MIKMPPDQLHYWTSITQGSIEPCVVLLLHCCCCFSSCSPPVWIYWLDGIERQEDTHRRKSKHVNGKNSLSISPHLSIPAQQQQPTSHVLPFPIIKLRTFFGIATLLFAWFLPAQEKHQQSVRRASAQLFMQRQAPRRQSRGNLELTVRPHPTKKCDLSTSIAIMLDKQQVNY